jgi:glycosyltransferase involved in cell wall biosynthesis
LRQIIRRLHQGAICLPWKALGSAGLYSGAQAPVQFVVEKAEWAIKWVGEHVRDEIEVIRPGTVQITTKPQRSFGNVVHFGSQYMWLSWGHLLSDSNRFVTSFFHGKPEDGEDVARHIDTFLQSVRYLDCVVTAAGIMEQRLLSWGVPREKLVRIPIGVDMKVFMPPASGARGKARSYFGIPDHAYVIGSFQKDGVGWKDGMEPKMIKGPDIFLDAIGKLKAAGIPVLVLLTGPARGYVKRGLERLSIPFVHTYVHDHHDLVACYHALDLYLVTSREEGGPMGLMESMASGVPVVSTRVGMAPDLIVDGTSGMLADEISGQDIASKALTLINFSEASLDQLRSQALRAVKVADWPEVARSHWSHVYQTLVDIR